MGDLARGLLSAEVVEAGGALERATLSLLAGLVPGALLSSNISPASLFRIAEKHLATLPVDEADSFLRDKEELL